MISSIFSSHSREKENAKAMVCPFPFSLFLGGKKTNKFLKMLKEASSVAHMLSNLNTAVQATFPSVESAQIIHVDKYNSRLPHQFISQADKI